jgi:hypothetical protein
MAVSFSPLGHGIETPRHSALSFLHTARASLQPSLHEWLRLSAFYHRYPLDIAVSKTGRPPRPGQPVRPYEPQALPLAQPRPRPPLPAPAQAQGLSSTGSRALWACSACSAVFDSRCTRLSLLRITSQVISTGSRTAAAAMALNCLGGRDPVMASVAVADIVPPNIGIYRNSRPVFCPARIVP